MKILPSGLLLCLVLFISSCEEDFEPMADSEAAFSVYGFLDNDAPLQVVRVVPLRDQLHRRYSQDDLHFSLTTESTRGQHLWENQLFLTDSLEVAVGSTAEFKPQPGNTYQLHIKDPATGYIAQAQTHLPEPIHPDQLLFDTIYERDFFWVQNLFLDGVTEPHFMEAIYTVRNIQTDNVDSVYIGYTGKRLGRPVEGRGTAYVLHLGEDADSVYTALNLRKNRDQLELVRIQMRMSLLSEEWKIPAGIRHYEELAMPGLWSNVSYGLGFFGSVTRTRRNVPTLNNDLKRAIGF